MAVTLAEVRSRLLVFVPPAVRSEGQAFEPEIIRGVAQCPAVDDGIAGVSVHGAQNERPRAVFHEAAGAGNHAGTIGARPNGEPAARCDVQRLGGGEGHGKVDRLGSG